MAAPHMPGTVKLPAGRLAGSRYGSEEGEEGAKSTNVDPETEPVGGPEYVGRSTFVGGNYRTTETLPTLQSHKEKKQSRLPTFLGGSRNKQATRKQGGGGSGSGGSGGSGGTGGSNSNSNSNSNGSPARSAATSTSPSPFYPQSSRRRVVSKSDKRKELVERHLVPLIEKYGEFVGDERIHVHTSDGRRYRPGPTPQRSLTTTRSASNSLSVLLDPSRDELLRSQRWMYRRSSGGGGGGGGGSTGGSGRGASEQGEDEDEEDWRMRTIASSWGAASTLPTGNDVGSSDDAEADISTAISFFDYVQKQVDELTEFSEKSKEECPLLSMESVRRVLHRIGVSNVDMTVVRHAMSEAKRCHREGDARARVIYELRSLYTRQDLTAAAVAFTGMHPIVASEFFFYFRSSCWMVV